jgi:alkyl sulfatase BDS1-like metallo-beta-lactamase superfamily hydrolase
VQWRFSDSGTDASLRIRRSVAVPGSIDADADVTLTLDLATWAALYAGDTTADEAEAAGALTIDGDRAALIRFFSAFDQPNLARAFA